MTNGWIYILVNPALKGNFLKIGKTTRSPSKRANELSTSGLPADFTVAYKKKTLDCDYAEKIIHQKLEQYRYSKNREFFCLPLEKAKSIVNETIYELDHSSIESSVLTALKNFFNKQDDIEIKSKLKRQTIREPRKTSLIGRIFFSIFFYIFVFFFFIATCSTPRTKQPVEQPKAQRKVYVEQKSMLSLENPNKRNFLNEEITEKIPKDPKVKIDVVFCKQNTKLMMGYRDKNVVELQKGDKLFVMKRNDTWFKVSTAPNGQGKVGWINEKFLSK